MAGTRWVRLDDDYFYHHPKTMQAGKATRTLHLAARSAGRPTPHRRPHPHDVVPILCRLAGVNHTTVDKLVNAGLWVRTETDFYIHDYLEHNPQPRRGGTRTRELAATPATTRNATNGRYE